MTAESCRTARRAPCPTCGVRAHEYCTEAGEERALSHPARVAAAAGIVPITSSQREALRSVLANESKYIDPSMRKSLLDRGWIVSLDPRHPPGGETKRRLPPRRHRVTDAGRAAIGVAITNMKEVACG